MNFMAGVHGARGPLRYALFSDFYLRLLNNYALYILAPADEFLVQGADGSRQPTEIELSLAEEQGKAFYEAVSKVSFP
jgi:hypothetical protein